MLIQNREEAYLSLRDEYEVVKKMVVDKDSSRNKLKELHEKEIMNLKLAKTAF